MKKNIKMYCGNFNACPISIDLKPLKYALKCNLITYNTYTLEEIGQLKQKLLENGVEIQIDLPDNNKKNKKDKKEYCKCGDCIYFDEEFKCMNDSAKIRNKYNKSKLSKGCAWAEQ